MHNNKVTDHTSLLEMPRKCNLTNNFEKIYFDFFYHVSLYANTSKFSKFVKIRTLKNNLCDNNSSPSHVFRTCSAFPPVFFSKIWREREEGAIWERGFYKIIYKYIYIYREREPCQIFAIWKLIQDKFSCSMNFLKIILRECIFTSGWVDLAGRVYNKCLNCWDLINFKKKQSFFLRLRITNLHQIHFTILRLIYLKSFFII